MIRFRFDVYVSNEAAGHLQNAGAVLAEALVANKNNVCTLPVALAGSANPVTAATAQAGYPVASDAAFNATTAVPSINGANDTLLTVTNNNAGGIAMDATVKVTAELYGSQ